MTPANGLPSVPQQNTRENFAPKFDLHSYSIILCWLSTRIAQTVATNYLHFLYVSVQEVLKPTIIMVVSVAIAVDLAAVV